MANYFVSALDDSSGKHNLFVTDLDVSGAYGGIGLGSTGIDSAYARLSATVNGLNVTSKAVTLDASGGYSLQISEQGYTFSKHAGRLSEVGSTFYTGGIVATIDNSGNLVPDTGFHMSLDQMRQDVCGNMSNITTLTGRADRIDLSYNEFKSDQTTKNSAFRTDICGAQSNITTLTGRADTIDLSYNEFKSDQTTKNSAFRTDICGAQTDITNLASRTTTIENSYSDFTNDVQTTLLNFTDNINNVNNSVTMIESQFGSHLLNQAKAINKIATVFDGLGFMRNKLLDTTGIFDDTGAKAMVAEFRVSPGPNPGALTDNTGGNNLTTYNYRTNKGITTQIGLNQDSNGNVYIIQPTSYVKPGSSGAYKPAGNWNFGGFSCRVTNTDDSSFEDVDLSNKSEITSLSLTGITSNDTQRSAVRSLLNTMWTDIDNYGNANSLIASNTQGKPQLLPALVLNSNMPSEMYNMTDLGTNVDLSNKSIGLTTSVTSGKTFIVTNIKSKTAIVTWQTPAQPMPLYTVSDPFTINGGAYNVYKVSGGYLAGNKNITYAYRGFIDNTKPLSQKVTITTIPASSVNIQTAVITSSPTLALSSAAMSANNVYEGYIKQGTNTVNFKLYSQGSQVYGFNGKNQSPVFTFDVYNGNIVNNTVNNGNMSVIFSTGMSKNNPISVMYTVQPLVTGSLNVDSTQPPTSYSFTLYGNNSQLSKVGPSGISGNPPLTDHLVIV
jgi:hypothetical protein